MAELAIAHQAEGMTVSRLEARSAAMGGQSMNEWRTAVLAKMKGDPSLKAASDFLEARNWTGAGKGPQNTNAFAELIGQQGYSTEKNGLPSAKGMMGRIGSGLIYDKGWQPRTSVSYVTRYTPTDHKEKTIPKGKQIGDVKTEVFTNPELEPGIVARAGVVAPLGSFVKIDADTNPLRYARVIDAKPDASAAAEINIAAGQNRGDLAFDPNTSSGTLPATIVSSNPTPTPKGIELPMDAKLTNAETQYSGYLAEVKKEPYSAVSSRTSLTATMKKYEKDADFTAYKKQVDAALTSQEKALKKRQEALQKKSGDRVEKGVSTVFGGKDLRQIATVTSPTQSGDALLEGRRGTYAGPALHPVSTLGSKTEQQANVVSALPNVFVSGDATSKPA